MKTEPGHWAATAFSCPHLKAQQLSDLLKKSLPTQGPRDEIFFIHPEFICLFFSPYKAWN